MAALLYLGAGAGMCATLLGRHFEIVATAVIARFAFGERIDGRLKVAIALITSSCVLLSFDSADSLKFAPGSLLVLGACLCWGVENNCTAAISDKDPAQIVAIKGVGSGSGALAIAMLSGEPFPDPLYSALSLVLGFFAYGLSIFFYVKAQSGIGASRTSAYYAASPFIGTAVSWLIFRSSPGAMFWLALVLMVLGSILASCKERPRGSQ